MIGSEADGRTWAVFPKVEKEWSDKVALSADDYLQGVIGTSNELVSETMLSLSFTSPMPGAHNLIP
jgi:hypothetical protein